LKNNLLKKLSLFKFEKLVTLFTQRVNVCLTLKTIMAIYDHYLFMTNKESLASGIFKDKIECGRKYV